MARKDWTENHKDYLIDGTNDIISTKELINRAIMLTGNDGLVQSNICKELMKIKAIRSQTNALQKNSESSDFLARVGIFIGFVGVIASGVGAWYTYLAYIN